MSFILNPEYEDEENVKECLKTVKIAKIDFEDQIRKYDYLMKFGQKEEAGKIVKNMNDKLNERFSGIEEIKIISSLLSGSFSIDTISQQEYDSIIANRDKLAKKILLELER